MKNPGLFYRTKTYLTPATTQYDVMLQFSQVPYLVYCIIILTNQNLYIIGKKQPITSLATTWEKACERTCTV